MIYNCCNQNRKAAALGNPDINGIDYLEVLDREAIPLHSPRQRTLLVHCLRPVPNTLTAANVVIEGGESIVGIGVDWVAPASAPPPAPVTNALERAYFQALPEAANILVVRAGKAGDFSAYTLRLVNDATVAKEDPFPTVQAAPGFDPQLSEVQFSFKVECGPDFDCGPRPPNCPAAAPAPPPINYLAKDYGSFRSILLDRLGQLLPNWSPATEADLGVVLAELIAYAGDYLSYQQDAIATEAYLGTARSRISLRRHALLVDYHVHEGCNARAWVRLQVAASAFLDRANTRFYTFAPGMPKDLSVGSGNEEAALRAGVQVFEPVQDAMLFPEHNQLSFYTWGDSDCCLPAGSTEATLSGTLDNLHPGDVLIFQELLGPQTGDAADADLRHRCAVRLTRVATRDSRSRLLVDPLYEEGTGLPIVSPAIQKPTPVTEIQWAAADALPFPVCLSSTFRAADGTQQNLTDVSAAFGNVVLADHGLSLTGIDLGSVPEPRLFYPPDPAADRCQPGAPVPLPVRYRPVIPDRPLTQAVPVALAGSPVTAAVVPLAPTGPVSLPDAGSLPSLLVEAVDPASWPPYFGVQAKANAAHPANLDLTVAFLAAGAAVVLESFTDLSLKPADPNYVAKQINARSELIHVPAGYVPPANPPAGYPPAPAMLPSQGPVTLLDGAAKPFLTLQATNPIGWPPLFGVMAQPAQPDTGSFDLLLVYDPPSGGVGVTLPVTVQQADGISPATAAFQFGEGAPLIRIASLAGTPDSSLSANDLASFDASRALPAIRLDGAFDGQTTAWHPAADLLSIGESTPAFVVEVESDGTAVLRFGDNVNGRQPDAGTAFTARYRVGNGAQGNVGAESLVYLATADARIVACTNPLPATGGLDPETNDQIRRRAPQAFLTQERAVTMADYQAAAQRSLQVKQAAASLRWTGSWYTVFIAAEPQGGGTPGAALQPAIEANVDRYRLAGQDLEIDSPQYLSLEIVLQVCVDPGYFRSNVEQALLELLGSGIAPGGTRGFFHPDNFGFGQSVYLSPIYAAARTVAGVTAVRATTFQPQGFDTPLYLSMGQIKLGPTQIARLANDPSFPDRGQLTLVMEGGK